MTGQSQNPRCREWSSGQQQQDVSNEGSEMWPGLQDRAEAAVAPLVAMMVLSLSTDGSEAQGSGGLVSAMIDQSLDPGGSGAQGSGGTAGNGTECSSSAPGKDDLELGPGPWRVGLRVIAAQP